MTLRSSYLCARDSITAACAIGLAIEVCRGAPIWCFPPARRWFLCMAASGTPMTADWAGDRARMLSIGRRKRRPTERGMHERKISYGGSDGESLSFGSAGSRRRLGRRHWIGSHSG